MFASFEGPVVGQSKAFSSVRRSVVHRCLCRSSYLVVLRLDDMVTDISAVYTSPSDRPHEPAGCIRVHTARDVSDASVLRSDSDQVVDGWVVASLNIGSMFSKDGDRGQST